MTDVVNIISGNSYAANGSYITCFDSTISFPGLELGAEVAPVVAGLIDAGFNLFQYDGSGNSTTFLLIRPTAAQVSCNPLSAFNGRLGTNVTVTTAAGTESGILQLVGVDVVQISEPSGDILLIPEYSIESVI